MTPSRLKQFVPFYYLDLHFLQFPIPLIPAFLNTPPRCLLTPPLAPHLAHQPGPPPPWTPIRPHLDLVFIISFFTLISMLTPLSAQCTCAQCTHAQCNLPLILSLHYGPFAMVPLLWSLRYGLFAMVPLLWSFHYGPGAMVPSLWSLCYGPGTMVPLLWSLRYGLFAMVPLLWSLKDDAKYLAGEVIKGAVVIDFPQESLHYGPFAMVSSLWYLRYGPNTDDKRYPISHLH